MPMRSEVWVLIDGFPGYAVSSGGRVRNQRTGGVLKPMLTGKKGNQYETVRLSSAPRIDRKIHRLVLEAFRGKSPEGRPIGCHEDENRRNNKLRNLFWGSQRTNMRMVTHRKDRKLPHEKRREVLELLGQGQRGSDVARLFGVSPQLISDIKCGRKHV